MHDYNNKEFWNLAKQLKGDKKFNNNHQNDQPPFQESLEYYKNLLQKKTESEIPHKAFDNLEESPLDKEYLNKPISKEEIKEAIKQLRTNKSPGIDNISNEMLKCSNDFLIGKIGTLFNLIFDSNYYPNTWNHGLIQSIYKSGSKNDPSNYRGITLMICLRKLYSTILFRRIKNEVDQKNIIADAQAGFRKKYRTTDHIFTLFSLIKKYLKSGKKLYTCFVDFRKAYDSICRKRLILKLKEIGLSRKILRTIEVMYSSPKLSLVSRGHLSEPFLI